MWERVICSGCSGYGLVETMAGVEDCKECDTGLLYRHQSGTLALWPGGPFAGSDKTFCLRRLDTLR